VLVLDYRGHGQSKYDRNPRNYTLTVALADLSAVLTALKMRGRYSSAPPAAAYSP
jgi:pimeloyl-ACP methyl ester carboxylesterase